MRNVQIEIYRVFQKIPTPRVPRRCQLGLILHRRGVRLPVVHRINPKLWLRDDWHLIHREQFRSEWDQPHTCQTAGGEGPVTSQEVVFTVTFTSPFNLSSDHYFSCRRYNYRTGSSIGYQHQNPSPAVLGRLIRTCRGGYAMRISTRIGSELAQTSLGARQRQPSISRSP